MAQPGELLGAAGVVCDSCGARLNLEVLESAGGYYLGYYCCGPISRETVYFELEEDAQRELDLINDCGTSIYTR